MSRHTHASPMDFKYENGTGPLDSRSPFAQISQNAQRPAPNMSTKKRERNCADDGMQGLELTGSVPGSYSAFDSPSKSRQTSPNKPLPAKPPAYNAMYGTPRKPANDIDDSSAGETPRSPEQKDDSDATPDSVHPRTALSRFDPASLSALPALSGAERNSPEKERPSPAKRDSFIMRFKSKFHSPGRGEVPRADRLHVTEKKIDKRRRRAVDHRGGRRRRLSVSDSGDDSERGAVSPRKTSQQSGYSMDPPESKPHWLGSFFTFIAQHPTVPHVLSFYAQLAFNMFLLGGCAYLIYCFWSAVQGDVDKKAHEAMVDILAEMAACAEQYTVNKCDPTTRIPAMATVCDNWRKCMERDATRVGRAKVSAHTFAEIFNSFVEPISYKAMIFTFVLVFGCFAISNFAFGFFRGKTGGGMQYNQGYYNQPPPPTPQRTFSGQEGGYYGTPWHQPMVGFEPQPSDGFGQIEGRGSPVKRLMYN